MKEIDMTKASVDIEVVRAAQGGDQNAMWIVISEYDGVLMSIVRSVAPAASRTDVEDLHQEARAALITCLRAYDTTSDASLSSYAYASVRRAVAEHWVRSTTSLTVDPTAVLRVRRALWTSEGDIEGAWMLLSMSADSRKIMSREVFVSCLETLHPRISLDAPVSDDESDGDRRTLADDIPDVVDTESDTDRRDFARWLLTQISPRQSYALRAFYGIRTQQMPDEAVADELGIRPATLRQLRKDGKDSARRVAGLMDLDLTRTYRRREAVSVAA
ncbi:sigma-70 family RNA polymerase sigma factor [Streptomyces sp. H27-H1]|uniref:sigma-70 family RNA polymerase sigma factor n=1 Tax=Streptomyces sp. H27-H1 TaxID=2996461 RepID=UPI00226F408E|nr:sigma-70 family RNA polymerase sigma factor [Streptomyces sp. H27-H1]MCY0926266.1 sigma-70 family RNA polymerase sigma factor [Streptomyces sp. H27-H1]